ncbi:hypothetical protein E2C01_061291 [Portunus trituberculatus]|uniref:Uncharacterized protein n=1 Tax=Portunus trituberculatus TaxID=210409 RepID=A0A5B7HC16_PORTR|nr:hypothetical protein [Portunus trituberculatus]
MITSYLPLISPHWQPDTKQPSSRWVEACCTTHDYDISPLYATQRTDIVMPLRAPRTDCYHHSAIPTMVRAINS